MTSTTNPATDATTTLNQAIEAIAAEEANIISLEESIEEGIKAARLARSMRAGLVTQRKAHVAAGEEDKARALQQQVREHEDAAQIADDRIESLKLDREHAYARLLAAEERAKAAHDAAWSEHMDELNNDVAAIMPTLRRVHRHHQAARDTDIPLHQWIGPAVLQMGSDGADQVVKLELPAKPPVSRLLNDAGRAEVRAGRAPQ